jgi:hypothetical protein
MWLMPDNDNGDGTPAPAKAGEPLAIAGPWELQGHNRRFPQSAGGQAAEST